MSEVDIQFEDLEPYKSLILGKMKSNTIKTELVEDCLNDICDILKLDTDSDERARIRCEIENGQTTYKRELEHGFVHYELEKPVSWTNNYDITDVEHHIALITRRKGTDYVALYLSENSQRRQIRDKFGNLSYDGLGKLKEIPPERLNAVFFGDQVRTLWMSGMHQRVPVKADAKILSGTDLEYTLDPINDQTFYFSAARSRHPDIQKAIGISPNKSRIWTQRSANWTDYQTSVRDLLDLLNDKEGTEGRPLPVLAEFADPDNVGSPYDLVIQPSELLGQDTEQEQETLNRVEEWAYDADFNVRDESSSTYIVAEVNYRGNQIGKLIINLNNSDPLNVEIDSVTTELTVDELPEKLRNASDEDVRAGETGKEEDSEVPDGPLSELKELCEDPRKIKIYFDTGHTLSSGSLYKARFRDQSFENFLWAEFDDRYDITKEKPEEFPSGGDEVEWDDEQECSLFRWVRENWPPNEEPWQGAHSAPGGWLACDDDSTEVADFVHLTTRTNDPVVSLVHVKAARNDSSNREISVAKYEKVTAQAVKNLRNLDHQTLGSNLNEAVGNKIGNYVWNDGEYAEREEMVEELENLGNDYERRVVVVQPHIQKSHFERISDENESENIQRLKQLYTLLLGAENACNGLGAKFHVISAVG
jgi:hypothetical protein